MINIPLATVNDLIAQYKKQGDQYIDFDSNQVSDGYHTFGELYTQRGILFIALAKQFPHQAWRYTKNADGAQFDGFFGMGIFPAPGKQITFHLANDFLPMVENIKHFETNPYFDGHNAADVLDRLSKITEFTGDTVLVRQNQKLAARNREQDISITKLNAQISELEEKLERALEKLPTDQKA